MTGLQCRHALDRSGLCLKIMPGGHPRTHALPVIGNHLFSAQAPGRGLGKPHGVAAGVKHFLVVGRVSMHAVELSHERLGDP